MTATHSRIGASTCERWWNCPGSVALVATLPPQESSVYAEEGIAAHELAEICLREDKHAEDYVGQFSKKGIEWTAEMAEYVELYLETIRYDAHINNVHVSKIIIEHKFHLISIDPNAFGTNDANLPIFLQKVIVYDLKYGQGLPVDVENNKQLMYYGLGAIDSGDYEEAELVIVQPRAPHKDGTVRRWTISKAELDEFAEELKLKIAETKKANAPRVCGAWCRKTFCPAMSVCPEVRKTVEEKAMTVFDDSREIKLVRPEDLTSSQLRQILDAIPLVDAWCKSVFSYAEQKANNGEKIEGYKLVRGKEGNRKWIDEKLVVEKFSGEIVELYDKVLKSPAQLEKAIGKKRKKEIDAITSRSEGRIILVEEEDPRETVEPNSTEVFKTIEEDLF